MNTSPHAWALISWSATRDTCSAICNARVGLRDVTDHTAISSDTLKGQICFHGGDEANFRATVEDFFNSLLDRD